MAGPYYVACEDGSFSVTNGERHVDTVDDYNVALAIANEENDRCQQAEIVADASAADVRDPDVELDFLDLEG